MAESELKTSQLEVEAMAAKLEVESLRGRHEGMEDAAKAEKRTLVKEVKVLRSAMAELSAEITQLKKAAQVSHEIESADFSPT